jgi:hypothetical protein
MIFKAEWRVYDTIRTCYINTDHIAFAEKNDNFLTVTCSGGHRIKINLASLQSNGYESLLAWLEAQSQTTPAQSEVIPNTPDTFVIGDNVCLRNDSEQRGVITAFDPLYQMFVVTFKPDTRTYVEAWKLKKINPA